MGSTYVWDVKKRFAQTGNVQQIPAGELLKQYLELCETADYNWDESGYVNKVWQSKSKEMKSEILRRMDNKGGGNNRITN